MLPLIGRRREVCALAALLRRGSRALVLGPRGMGKTRLMLEAAAASGVEPVRASSCGPLHEFLQDLLSRIHAGEAPASVRRLTSQALQARLLRALQERPCWLWLDDPEPAGARLYRFLERVLWTEGCGLAVSAESRSHLGHLGRLVWDPREEIVLRPLGRAGAAKLLEEAMYAFGVESRGPALGFRQHVLEAAAGNPGRIVTLCRLAAQPQYWHGGRLMFAPLWIDTLTHLA